MRRTILSENQYDPKFMTAAKMNAIMIPLDAAEQIADHEQQPAQRTEQQRRLQSVWHVSQF